MIRAVSRHVLTLIVLLLSASCQQASYTTESAAADVSTQLDQLYAGYDEEFLVLNPMFATFRGDNRFNDQWGAPYDRLSDEYAAAAYGLSRRFLDRLLAIDPSSLGVQDRLNYDIFQLDRENAIERHDLGYSEFESLTPVSQFFSTPNFLVMLGLGATAQPFKTPKDYDNWITRSSGFVGHVDLSISKMISGLPSQICQRRFRTKTVNV